MDRYALLKAANRTVSDDKIFNPEEFSYIEDFTTWTIVENDEPMTIASMSEIIPATVIDVDTVRTDNLIIANKEFDDIIRSIVKDALKEGQQLKASQSEGD